MRARAALCAALAVSACQSAAQDDGFGGPTTTWRLVTLDGAAFAADATLTFPDGQRLAGQAPCNSYFGPLTAPYPAFAAPVIAASKRACPDLRAEAAYFAALSAVTGARRDGDTLTLSDTTGPRLVFTIAD
ncbi:MAG: META domain-containing protein [Pseudomonadota bacterium]